MSVDFAIEEGVGVISLNRAPANAYDWEMLRGLTDAVRRAREDPAVRVAVVARSVQYEKEQVSPASLTLWEAGDPGDPPPSRALTGDERHYRYKVFTTIVPIRNVIWGG